MSICSISGVPAEEPVVSLKSGHIFEKRLIVKYVEANGKCPVTGEELGVADLLDVQNSAKSPALRVPSATSLPALLELFRNEWDSAALETFTLRKQLDTCRKELAHALYQHDAACRVIARLVKERDAARDALVNARVAASNAAAAAPMDTDSGGQLPSSVAKVVNGKMKELSGGRKARVKAAVARVKPIDALSAFRESAKEAAHGAKTPKITSLDCSGSLSVSGAEDASVVVFDLKKGRVLQKLSHHKGIVRQVCFHQSSDSVLSVGDDGECVLWKRSSANSKYAVESQCRHDGSAIVSVASHPTGAYACTVGADNTWRTHDLSSGRTLGTCAAPQGVKLTTGAVHPDGLVFATGTASGSILLWDLLVQKQASEMSGHTGAVASIAFHENGYLLATCSTEDNSVRLWDLRKQVCLKSLAFEDGFAPHSVRYDRSGSYLAVSGANLRVFAGKALEPVVTLQASDSSKFTSAAFGEDVSCVVAATASGQVITFR